MSRRTVTTDDAPPPAGHYCQAVRAGGNFVFVSGQTPRTADGKRLEEASFEAQVHQTLKNLRAIARACGLTLDDAVKVTVYLRRHEDRSAFDRVYREYFEAPSAARAMVQSSFVDFDVEIDAILLDRHCSQVEGGNR